MDPFTAAADTWKFRNAAARPDHLTVKDVGELVAAEHLRPIPAQSDYLDTAASPVPWPDRTEARQPGGGRPRFGAEKRLTGSKRAAALTCTSPCGRSRPG